MRSIVPISTDSMKVAPEPISEKKKKEKKENEGMWKEEGEVMERKKRTSGTMRDHTSTRTHSAIESVFMSKDRNPCDV